MKTRTIKLTISYDGTNYCGWQKQSNTISIQEEIENRLSIILTAKIVVHGAGRTDAGVHAIGMTAHFQTKKSFSPTALAKSLNSMLPADIRIVECEEQEADFHSRYNATGKTYCYYIYTGKVQPPTQRLYAIHCPHDLNIDAMQQCLEILTGTHDFSSFESTGSRDKSITTGRGAIRTITHLSLAHEENSLQITIQGDGFLRHMVRNIVGTLLDVGRGRKTTEEFRSIFGARDRSEAGAKAPAHGLFLNKVYYNNEQDRNM